MVGIATKLSTDYGNGLNGWQPQLVMAKSVRGMGGEGVTTGEAASWLLTTDYWLQRFGGISRATFFVTSKAGKMGVWGSGMR